MKAFKRGLVRRTFRAWQLSQQARGPDSSRPAWSSV